MFWRECVYPARPGSLCAALTGQISGYRCDNGSGPFPKGHATTVRVHFPRVMRQRFGSRHLIQPLVVYKTLTPTHQHIKSTSIDKHAMNHCMKRGREGLNCCEGPPLQSGSVLGAAAPHPTAAPLQLLVQPYALQPVCRQPALSSQYLNVEGTATLAAAYCNCQYCQWVIPC